MISRPGYPIVPLCGLRPGPSSIWVSVSPLSQRISKDLANCDLPEPCNFADTPCGHISSLAPGEDSSVTAYAL